MEDKYIHTLCRIKRQFKSWNLSSILLFFPVSYQVTPGDLEKFRGLNLSCKEPQKPADGLSEHPNFSGGTYIAPDLLDP